MKTPDETRAAPPAHGGSQRGVWIRIGYAATAAWMVFVLARSESDPADPLFATLFTVPLAAWIVAVAAVRAAAWWRGRGRRREERS